MAATRLGCAAGCVICPPTHTCVQPMMPCLQYPASRRYWVICVVLPDPVSPTTMTTWFSRITCRGGGHQHLLQILPDSIYIYQQRATLPSLSLPPWQVLPLFPPPHTCSRSSRTVYTGSERRCCPIVLLRLNSDAASFFFMWDLNCPPDFLPPPPSPSLPPPPPSSASAAALASSAAFAASSCSSAVRPVMLAILEPEGGETEGGGRGEGGYVGLSKGERQT